MKLGKHRQIAMKARRENCVEYNNYSNGTVLILVLMRVFFFSNVRHLVGHVNLMHRDPKAGRIRFDLVDPPFALRFQDDVT
jgi:hypothetical protein